ncbi:DUF3224 domain-containing protein [Marinicella litoralis]|uniref:Uncharacterized protein DUF3224 n=1 Tax=Marinicella litoralis TaxID=644220 RepID=A0A4R6XS70_9GAMM|nr:DUF3224 domain-containing protein [Marinicella litoralis]TDR22606.1 uncharacterized protein DUF3224 [Marinicella litoralis]
MRVSGKFTVQMQAQEASFEGSDGINVTRMSLDKTYKGELSAHSQGEMLSAVTTTTGSAGYVAIEQVTGSLSGQSGSFVLQHSGIMDQGDAQLTLTVVPDSGSGELKTLSGTMDIRIDSGEHHYDFDYELDVLP